MTNERVPRVDSDLEVDESRTAIAVRAGDRLVLPAGTFHAVRTRDEAVEIVSVQSPPILDATTGVLDLEPIQA